MKQGSATRLIYAGLCGGFFVAAVAIRVRAAFNDLWLDEIWSIELVQRVALGARREMMGDKPANYYQQDRWPSTGAEWVLFHKDSMTAPVPPGRRFTDKFDNAFELARTFPTAPLSGVHLFVYRRISAPARRADSILT